MSMNYNVIGGVIADLHPDFVKDVKHLIEIMPERLKEYHKVFSGNLIAKNRLKGVGMLSKEDAVNYAITGPSGRGSNWSCDCRKKHPYAAYSEVEFDEILLDGCDSYSRYMVRMKEIEQSCRILEQLVDEVSYHTADDIIIHRHARATCLLKYIKHHLALAESIEECRSSAKVHCRTSER